VSGDAPVAVTPARAPERGSRTVDTFEGPRHLGASAEEALVRTVVVARSLLDRVTEHVDGSMLRDRDYRAIFETLRALGPDATVDELASHLAPRGVALLQMMLANGTMGADPARVIDDSLARLRERARKERLAELQRLMSVAVGEEKDKLLSEMHQITSKRKTDMTGRVRGAS
jgi:hypothetical protein